MSAKHPTGSSQYRRRDMPEPGSAAIDPPDARLSAPADFLPFEWDDDIRWNSIEPTSVARAVARYAARLVDVVHDAAALEGNTYTLPEVRTLLDGVTVGGHPLAEQTQILNLARSVARLRALTLDGTFALSKSVSDELHCLIAEGEAIEIGGFRGEGDTGGGGRVNLGDGRTFQAVETEPGGLNLVRIFEHGTDQLQQLEHPVAQGVVYFMLAAYSQFYFDGNKRTGRAMMNGHLMSHGYEAISVPASRKLDFNEALIELYGDGNGSRTMHLMYEIYRESEGF